MCIGLKWKKGWGKKKKKHGVRRTSDSHGSVLEILHVRERGSEN